MCKLFKKKNSSDDKKFEEIQNTNTRLEKSLASLKEESQTIINSMKEERLELCQKLQDAEISNKEFKRKIEFLTEELEKQAQKRVFRIKSICIKLRNDNPVGVRIRTLDEDFVISLHDAENGEEKGSVEWQQYYKQNNCRTFNRKQACIIAAYLDEINNKLVEAGGDKLDKWYWTDTSCNDYAWTLESTHSSIVIQDICAKSSSRPIL